MKSLQKTIIWDWNGTLLDDVNICVEAINSMLAERQLNQLTIDSYRSIFTFPVIDYYRIAGFDFDKENWEIVAMQFMDRYFDELERCPLFDDAVGTLNFFRDLGFRQVILSAMEQNALVASVNERGIGKYFGQILGIDNHYAGGKAHNGHAMINEHEMNGENTWFIGDTLHDAEIARQLGCQCVLVANGHQDFHRLASAEVPVLKSLSELHSFFKE
jgi:phosphoglycolate phosphatase